MCLLVIGKKIRIRINSWETFGLPKEFGWGRQTGSLGKIDRTGWGLVWDGQLL